ncbi:FAD-dependent oxidoreductase [Ensifer sp. ENS05]|uniref:NAD(P)/FAD-dependent oxidoreductase n=1 Tax=Ensifer sp. ENS05 TaxID=2769277 RepID=UPI00281182FA|nr:FAD-dependent oxidoreductase [Ensifer sp. ENS05]
MSPEIPAERRSLWRVTSRNRTAFETLQSKVEVDLVVVGGGICGLSTALHAAEANLSVAVLEAEVVAWGASGRNAGFVVPNFAKADPDQIIAQLGSDSGEALVQFAAGSADLVFRLVERHRINCHAKQSGWLQPAHSPGAFERVKSRVAQWQRHRRPATLLSGTDLETTAGLHGYVGGWLDPSGGVLNPVEYAYGLAAAAAGKGAKIFEDSQVRSITRQGDRWRLECLRGAVVAERVVLATNAYSGDLLPPLSQTYFPVRVFQMATRPLPQAIRETLLPADQCASDTRRNLFTLRFDADNRLISGGMCVFPVGADERVPAAIRQRLARHLGMRNLPEIEFSWSGTAAVQPNFLPRLVNMAPGVLAAFACNGRGVAMTTMMGRFLSQWASKTAPFPPVPDTPPEAIPFHRFMKYAPNVLLPWSMVRDYFES